MAYRVISDDEIHRAEAEVRGVRLVLYAEVSPDRGERRREPPVSKQAIERVHNRFPGAHDLMPSKMPVLWFRSKEPQYLEC